jgi:hypothetical protein
MSTAVAARDRVLQGDAQGPPVVAAQHDDAEAGGDARLEGKPGHRDNRTMTGHDAHMPSAGRRALRDFMLRYRPNAHTGKKRA